MGRRKPVHSFSYPHTAVAATTQLHARESQDRRKVEAEQVAAMAATQVEDIPAWFETLRYATFSLFAVPAAPVSQR